MWGRIKGQMMGSIGERDVDDDDTIISRALLRYYAPEVPVWLASAGGAAQIMEQNEQLNYQKTYQQQYIRKDSVDRTHLFERKDSVASLRQQSSTPSPQTSQSKPVSSSSKLADRLKNTKW